MYFNDDTIIFLDGQYVKASEAGVNLYNQTMHYGNGVFEGIRSYETEEGTKIFKAKEHYDRLHYSAEKMHIKLNYTVEELEQISYEVLKRNNLTDAYLRPLVYLGANMSLQPVEEVHVVIMAWEWGKYLGDKMLRLGLSSFQRPNPKSCHVAAKVVGHYTNSILATTEAKQNGYDEALLTDMNGHIAEGPGANFFLEKDGKLFTAPLGNILAGITRATVIELAQKLNIPLEEKFFTPEEVKTADAAFYCGTAAEVIGIESLDEYTFPKNWKDTKGAIIQRNYMNLVLHKELELA